MSVEVVMPQMGESITEGTVSKWLKAVGDTIEKDEPLLEISTDKVDAEVPAPGAGILLEIKAAEGETVEVGSVVGVIGEEGESGVSDDSSAPEEVSAPPKEDIARKLLKSWKKRKTSRSPNKSKRSSRKFQPTKDNLKAFLLQPKAQPKS